MNDLVERVEDRLADFSRDKRVIVLSCMALAIGALSAIVAYALVWLIAVITNVAFYQRFSSVFQSPDHHRLGYSVIFVPVIGGVIIGLIARYGSEKIRGHGIPEALEAILFGRSRMETKVAILKPLSSAISIGTGGPFGAEGPIIMTGGAVGSIFAQFFHLSSAERKTLLVAGAAAGMSAIFASPVAAALLAIELLLFEWRPRSFIPVAIAAASASAIRVPLLGLLIGKSFVWALALGSGTSGGVLAPLLMMGGALGAVIAPFIPLGDSGLWALIGMAAMMGGTMRSPLTAMIFTVELTQDFNLLPGLLVGCIAAHGVTVLLLRRSILTEKVARRGYHVMREYSVDPLTMVRVGEVMDRNVPTIPANMRLIDLSDRIASHDPQVIRHEGLLIVDDSKKLAGIITRGDVLRALQQNGHNDTTVLNAGNRDLVVAFADEVLYEALIKMLRNNIGRLPVVDRKNPRHIVGYLGRSNLMAGRLRHFEDEHVREGRFLRTHPIDVAG